MTTLSDSLPSPLPARRRNRAWGKFVRNRTALAGGSIVLLFVAAALLAPWLATHDPFQTSFMAVRKAPSAAFWLGSDELGRDIYSRLLYGARASLMAGLVSVVIALVVGVPFGLAAGYFGGWVDAVISRCTEALLAIPFLILAIALAASTVQPGVAQSLAYGKQVFDIVAGVQAELGKLTQGHIADGRAQVQEAVEHWTSRAPAGSDAAVAALKSTLASGYSAYDTFARAVKQAADAGQTNLNAAAKATFKAASDVASNVASNAAAASGISVKPASRGRRAAG